MKKILFAALAALAITSCSQNEEIEAPTQKTEINFRSVVGKSSRAAEATTENLESQGFILYAYNTKTITMDKVTAGSLTTTFINGKKATCTNSLHQLLTRSLPERCLRSYVPLRSRIPQ